MNSEELEQSLRTEFESYLKDVLADMRREITDFQEKVQTEIEKHKAQLDSVFQDFSSRLDTDKELDKSFTESVVEHLRLAKDEGARITAEAIAEAEEMAKESAPPPPQVSFSELRNAVSEISNQTSQAEILTALVDQAAHFTPRGAFFIVKNNYFVGWRVFGEEASGDDTVIREIFTPVDSDTILGESVRSLSTVESAYGTFDDDAGYLGTLDFGQPDRMYAIPLVARGRGVAVLYADYGQEGTSVNIEALEMLVRVAGLTVELLASVPVAKPVKEAADVQTAPETPQPSEQPTAELPQEYQTAVEEPQTAAEEYQFTAEEEEYQPSFQTSMGQEFQQPVDQTFQTEPEEASLEEEQEEIPVEEIAVEEETAAEEEVYFSEDETEEEAQEIPAPEDDFSAIPEPSYWDQPTEIAEEPPVPVEVEAVEDSYQFETEEQFEADESFETEPVAAETEDVEASEEYAKTTSDDFSTVSAPSFDSFRPEEVSSFEPQQEAPAPVADTVEAVSPPATSERVKSRFSDRNVDLPIDVSDDERRLHNDARRFARLLVSEIKLYNEQKVKEGREAGDIYERLREAIDRSREMYDKRVQPPVAAKFDYFHYELVNTLAEGREEKLGTSYVGAAV